MCKSKGSFINFRHSRRGTFSRHPSSFKIRHARFCCATLFSDKQNFHFLCEPGTLNMIYLGCFLLGSKSAHSSFVTTKSTSVSQRVPKGDTSNKASGGAPSLITRVSSFSKLIEIDEKPHSKASQSKYGEEGKYREEATQRSSPIFSRVFQCR